ncbi:MAG: leucine-rich repeat domain-containing protein [Flavobacteriaceae bacterium]|nr:leucine-rich repeat domain-containing protein [Flavobacteriaceae bacterium]
MKKISFILIIIMLFSCKDNIIADVSSEQDISLEFEYTLTSSVYQILANKSTLARRSTLKRRSSENVLASMTITNTDTGIAQDPIDWIVSLDLDSFTVSSDFIKILKPGNYSFHLDLLYQGYKYLGTSGAVSINQGNNAPIAIVITPVLGDIGLSYTVNSQSILEFNYDTSLIPNVVSPKIGYTIDSDPEIVIALNTVIEPELGINQVYINIPNGSHTIKLKLYDDINLVATSDAAQETINFVNGDNHTIDISPITTNIKINTPIDGGDFLSTFNIPYSVVNDIAGKTDLKGKIQITGSKTGNVEGDLTFVDDGTSYTSDITLNNIYYETVDIYIEIEDDGGSVFNITYNNISLNKESIDIDQYIGVAIKSLSSDKLLSNVLLKTVDIYGDPVNGVTVSIKNGSTIGITNGLYNVDGSLEFSSYSGTLTLVLNAGSKTVERTVILKPLEVTNIIVDWNTNSNLDFITDYKVIRDLRNLNENVIDNEIGNWNWNKPLQNVSKANLETLIKKLDNGNQVNGNGRITILRLKNIKYNNTQKIEELPLSIGNLEKLTELTLVETNISEIPKEVSFLQNLNNLNIQQSPVSCLYQEIWDMNGVTISGVSPGNVCN